MTDFGANDPAIDDEGSPLAELSEQITRRLQAGDPVEADDFLDRYPSCSAPIRGLLPTLRELAELGRSVSRGRRARRSARAEDRR